MERKTLATTILCVAGFAILVGELMTPTRPYEPRGCLNNNSQYSAKMESQINELCLYGLGRDEAIKSLEIIYRMPGINHDAAVKIVKLGADLAAHRNNPDPWKTQ